MKLPLILLLACNALALAERPAGFMGIPWGASPEEAKRILQKRPGVVFPENADDYHIELSGGTFAGQPVVKWVIEFPERKFAMAAVTIRTDGNAGSVYKEFCDQLVSKYGPTTAGRTTGGTSNAKNPQASALASSKLWKFLPTMKDKSQVIISAELSGTPGKRSNDPQGTVTIKYVNETLTGAAAAAAAAAVSGKTAAQPIVKKEDL